jgi:Protein of unknown function (DUF3102)
MTPSAEQRIQGQVINHLAGFDYSSVPVSVENFLRGQVRRIRHYVGKSIIQIGKDLGAAKRYLSHGQFLNWVEREVGIPARTAQGYMQVSQWASSKGATVAHLPPSVLYLLSARSTPTQFVEGILRRVEAGEKVLPATIRMELKMSRSVGVGRQSNMSTESDFLNYDADPNIETSNCDIGLMHVVSILSRSLSKYDIAQVHAIMTSNNVLNRSDLPDRIKIAFSTLTKRAQGKDPQVAAKNPYSRVGA